MSTTSLRKLSILALALLTAPTAWAGVPDGELVFEFDDPFVIYDFSQLSDCDSVSAAGLNVTLCIDTDMVGDAKGGYEGTATLEFTGDLVGTLVGPATAKIKSKADDGSAGFKFNTTGDIAALGDVFDTIAKASCKGDIAPGGFFDGICKVGIKIVGEGSAKVATAIAETLPAQGWTLSIDVTPLDEKKFEGTATDSLGFSYIVKGSHSDKTGLSKLKASGDKEDPGSKGASVQLGDLADDGSATAKYKLQGHKGKDVPVSAD